MDKWMEKEAVILSEVTETKKNKHWMLSFNCGS